MHKQMQMMLDFHNAFGHPTSLDEGLTPENINLRSKLIDEELLEFNVELFSCLLQGKIVPNLLKEGADLLYVIFGTFVSLGLEEQLIEAFKRVHESNMSKLGPDFKPIYREDGKVLKGPNYQPPDLEDLV